MPPPWTQQRKQREAPDLPSEDPPPLPVKKVLILLFVFARKPSPLGQPTQGQQRWKLERNRELAAGLLIGRPGTSRLRERPAPVGGHGPGLRGLGDLYRNLAALPLLCTAGPPRPLEMGAQFWAALVQGSQRASKTHLDAAQGSADRRHIERETSFSFFLQRKNLT